jgi:DNA-binding NarL/FixJ family response regulator
MNGIEATRQIKGLDSEIKVLALSMHSDSRFVTQMLKAGANGYLLKDCAFNELTEAMTTVSQNRTYLSPGITDLVVKAYLNQAEGETGEENENQLTSRERQVLQLLAEGKNTTEIGKTLNISGKTVDTHRRQIMTKLDIHSIAELTKYAIREGITIIDS